MIGNMLLKFGVANVMFLVVTVGHSVHGGRGRGSHMTITHDALDLTVKGPPLPGLLQT